MQTDTLSTEREKEREKQKKRWWCFFTDVWNDNSIHIIYSIIFLCFLGRATAFFNMSSNRNVAKALVDILSEANQEVPDFLRSASSQYSSGRSGGYGGGGGGRGGRGGRSQ